jgi:ketosteroid isomerase-like protein
MTERDMKTSPGLDAKLSMAVEEGVKQAAWQHINAEDAASALSWYEPDAIVASHGMLYPSFDRFADDVRAFYGNLREVRIAEWDDMYVQVLSADAAVLTATVRWSSSDNDGVRTDLKGVWTAVFVQDAGRWKIRARHESFEPEVEQ